MQVTALTPEQEALQGVARDVLDEQSSPERVRAVTEQHREFDRALWATAGELGWLGLELPESVGGSAQSFLETSLVLRELGRAATPGPHLSHALASTALAASPDGRPARAWLAQLATGDAIGAVVLGDRTLTGSVEVPLRIETRGRGVVVDGTATGALDVGLADVVVVAADGEDGPHVVVVDEPGEALATVWQPTHDRTRRLYDVTCRDLELPADAVLASGPAAVQLVGSLWHRAAAGIALDCVGGAARMVEITVAYTAERVQYGRPIATFQAVKHTCSDMYVESEVARIAADAAVLEIVAGGEREAYWSAVAKSRAGDAYAKAAGDALQMHGGIGMTWEFDLHLWLKRAKLNQALYGHPAAHRAHLSRLA